MTVGVTYYRTEHGTQRVEVSTDGKARTVSVMSWAEPLTTRERAEIDEHPDSMWAAEILSRGTRHMPSLAEQPR